MVTNTTFEDPPVNVHTDTPMLSIPNAVFSSPTYESGLNWNRLLNSARDLLNDEFTTTHLLLSGININVTLIKTQDRIEVELTGLVDVTDIEYVLEDLSLAINEANKTLPREVFILRSDDHR